MITPIDKTHWEDLYARLHDAYVECTVEGFNDCLTQIKRKLR